MEDSLGDALPKEQARVRKLIKVYLSVPIGYIAAAMMEVDLKAADLAIIEGDIPEMIRVYERLKAWKE